MLIFAATLHAFHGNHHHYPADPAQRAFRNVGNRADLGAPLEPDGTRQAGQQGGRQSPPAGSGPGQIPFHDSDRHHPDRHPDGYLFGRSAGRPLRRDARIAGHAAPHGRSGRPDTYRHRRNLPHDRLRRAGAQTHRHEKRRTGRHTRRTADAGARQGDVALRMAAFAQHRAYHPPARNTGYGEQGHRGGDQVDHSGGNRRRRGADRRTADRRPRILARRPQGGFDHDAPQRSASWSAGNPTRSTPPPAATSTGWPA